MHFWKFVPLLKKCHEGKISGDGLEKDVDGLTYKKSAKLE